MMHRRLRPIPLAAWIASRNPALRTRAETALYHYGPDAGEALFFAADSVSRYVAIKQTLILPPFLLLLVISLWLIAGVTQLHLAVLSLGSSVFVALRMIYIVFDELYYRRRRLKALALALTKRNDLRGIGPLLEAWRPLSISGRQIYDDEIEMELTRILPLFLAQQSIDLRSYKKRILRKKLQRLFPYSAARRKVKSRGQFTETRSDAIVTLIQLIARSNSEADHALLEHIGSLSTDDTHYISERNAVFIRDAALAFSAAASPPGEAVSPLSFVTAPMPTGSPANIQAVARRS